jgi:hypothetical protein
MSDVSQHFAVSVDVMPCIFGIHVSMFLGKSLPVSSILKNAAAGFWDGLVDTELNYKASHSESQTLIVVGYLTKPSVLANMYVALNNRLN